MDIAGFAKVAQYLTHPLALIGWVLMLFFGTHWYLMKSGLLRQVNQKDSSLIIRLFLRYGFWLGLALVLAMFLLQFSGIGLSAWNSYIEKEKVTQVNAGKLAEKLLAPLQGELAAKNEQIKALTEAITALSKADAPAKTINAALQELEKGNTKQAQAIFAEVLRSKEAEGQKANKEAAAAARHLGALAFEDDTKAALAAYQKAVQLDPDNAEGWNQLGILLQRTGELAKAEEAFRKVLALGETHKNKEEQAWAYGNLGTVYQIRGELDQVEQMYRKSLEINEALGLKEATANQYGNLGLLYQKRGELDQAEQMHKKSLEIEQAMGHREGMAQDYGNLGALYQIRGKLDQAEQMHKKSLEISEVLGLKEITANQYGNLGVVYAIRGELAQAEQMYKRSLEICEALGLKEATANQYINLGLVYEKRGNLDQAEKMWKKSLSLYQAM